jgi:Tfp pilus assembly protein PilV
MIKLALIALFVLSMGTLGLAASALPVEHELVTAQLR